MKTILVVEDQPINAELVSEILTGEGHEVLIASNAAAGIDLARTRKPHLILMDVQLPGLDGLTATRMLKDDPETAHIPVFALSAHAMQEDVEKARQAGCNGYVCKPISVPHLITTVEDALAKSPPA